MFDLIIANPPYSRNLHLKILDECLNHLSENGVIINISPIRWLQDYFIDKKRSSDFYKFENVRDHIEALEKKDAQWSQEQFGNVLGTDLGIYTLSNRGGFNIDSLKDSIIIKVLNKQLSEPTLDRNKKDGWRIRIPDILGGGASGGRGAKKWYGLGFLGPFFNGKKDNKPWYNFYQRNQFSKTTEEITQSISFNSENEANNCVESINSEFGQYVERAICISMNVYAYSIFWLGDVDWTNPNTGKHLVGYNTKWEKEDYIAFFELDEEECEKVWK